METELRPMSKARLTPLLRPVCPEGTKSHGLVFLTSLRLVTMTRRLLEPQVGGAFSWESHPSLKSIPSRSGVFPLPGRILCRCEVMLRALGMVAIAQDEVSETSQKPVKTQLARSSGISLASKGDLVL